MFLVTLFSFIVALSVLVFVHELGHYLSARRVGIVVEEFGFGYPPRIFSFWNTQGKVIIDGREIIVPRKLRLPEGLTSGSRVTYQTQTDKKERLLLAGIREVEPEAESADSASTVEYVDPGTMFSINAIPFGGFARMRGEEDPTAPGSLASKGKLARTFVLSAGSLMNLITAVAFFALAMGLGAPAVADPENAMVTGVAPSSPGEVAGLQPGDVVVQAGDAQVLKVEDLQEYTQDHLGESVILTVQRDAQMLQIEVVPRPDPPSGEGPIGITLSPRTTVIRHPWYRAVWLGIEQTVRLTGFIFTVPVQVIRGLIPANLARPVGPVGVGQLVGDAVQYSLDTGWWFPAMQMMGTLSVALAVTNLLPLPGLDGGRILFVIVEAIRGRRVTPEKEGVIHLIGLALMVALMVFITWQDVINPVPSIDWGSLF
jgi:regulator of sigma E protease